MGTAMRCAAFCALLCLPVPVLTTAKAPIRIMGSLATSPPVAPCSDKDNPLVPCIKIVHSGEDQCNAAGYPSMKAWMGDLMTDTRGVVAFATSDYRSRAVLAHPDGLMLNHAVWERLGLDFVTLRDEYLFSSSSTDFELVDYISQSPYPWVVSDFLVNNQYPHLMHLMRASHVKVVDGVKIGFLVMWTPNPDKTTGSFPHDAIVPVLTRRLRLESKVDKIVMFRTGVFSFSNPDFESLVLEDIDVIVTDSVKDGEPHFVRNGTTVLVAPYYSGRNDLLILDMVQDGSLWQYSLRAISLFDTHPAALSTTPAYLETTQWIQTQVDLVVSNDITVAHLAAPMPPAQQGAARLCRSQECEVGVLTADAMRERAGTQLALLNGGAVRAYGGWPLGPVTRSMLWSAYPFVNPICRVDIPGTVLLDTINHGISLLLPNGTPGPGRSGHFPQISGFRFTMNLQLPVGSRVVSLDVLQPDGSFAPLEKRRVYSFAATTYLLEGGSGYSMLAELRHTMKCFVTSMMEATQHYLQREEIYVPYLANSIAVDPLGVALPMRNQSFADCTQDEHHDAHWQDCVPCGSGLWRPDPTINQCFERASDGVDVILVAGIVLGVVLLIAAAALAWKMTEKQRRINALYNNNKVAEECAVTLMELRLSDLDYLSDIENPNTIQSAFIAIVKQMKLYMEFMPKNLLANYPQNCDADNLEHSGLIELVGPPLGESLCAQRMAASSVKLSPFVRKKNLSVLALNGRGHTSCCDELEPESVRVVHSQLLETFASVVDTYKGIAEPMCGDRLLAAWNTVVDRPNHSSLSCKAAYQLRFLEKEGVTPNVGLASGVAMFGLFRVFGTRKYDIVGDVVPAAMLLSLLNKEYSTQCLFPASMLSDASVLFLVYIVDYVSHPKLDDACYIYELSGRRRMEDTWMFEGDVTFPDDPFLDKNSEWKNLVNNTGYCCTCPGLALF